MESPFLNTYLYTTVTLHPSQMNNDIYKHLKNNLIRDLQGKCYKSYGYISKIYKIEERHGGNMIAEDSSASATYKVKFSCKLCKPLKGSTIVCEVTDINKHLVHIENGPINVLIFEGHDQINQNNFIFDEKRNVLLANMGNGKGKPVKKGTYVKIKVIDSMLEHGSERIIVIGTLESLASSEESNKAITSKENEDENFVDYNDYMSKEKNDNNDNNDTDVDTNNEIESIDDMNNDDDQ